MTIKPLHSKAEYKAALKIVSSLVDADPCRGTPEAEQSLGALIEAYEANATAMMALDCESRVILSQRDMAKFTMALSGAFNPYACLIELVLHGQLHEFGNVLQARAARQSDDLAHIGTLAVVDDALTAKA